MIARAMLAIVISLSAATSALAQMPPQPPPVANPFNMPGQRGTDQERDACHPDVMKFCRELVPDQFRVLGCLQSNRTRLSNACRGVLTSNGV
jgi:hypothetical protein